MTSENNDKIDINEKFTLDKKQIKYIQIWALVYSGAYGIGAGIGIEIDNMASSVCICLGIAMLIHAISLGTEKQR